MLRTIQINGLAFHQNTLEILQLLELDFFFWPPRARCRDVALCEIEKSLLLPGEHRLPQRPHPANAIGNAQQQTPKCSVYPGPMAEHRPPSLASAAQMGTELDTSSPLTAPVGTSVY